jgi:hypothetical protein
MNGLGPLSAKNYLIISQYLDPFIKPCANEIPVHTLGLMAQIFFHYGNRLVAQQKSAGE